MDFDVICSKWQKKWFEAGIWKAKPVKGKKSFFMIFAYPGISGYLHVGHMRGFTYTDIITRMKRMQGFNVLFPAGTHATGNQAIAFASKVKKRDEAWINYLTSNGYPENKLNELEDEKKVVEYFNKVYVEEYWKKFGFLADWERFACTVHSDYNKFIEWQFKKLNEKNLLVKKPYFAPFCPKDGPVAVDPSETDISKGGHAEKNEYTLLKFKFEDKFIVAATLRPETVFGQTNLWIDSNEEYSIIKVGKEKWILSKQAAEKLKFQKESVELINSIKGKDLIGKKVIAPGVEREIIILPSSFCAPDIGTGIVTSVPGDAPDDWMGLQDLKNSKELCEKHGLNWNEINSINAIPIIKTEGYGEFPAKDVCEKLKITNSMEREKLHEA
ncbi:MAG: class I tRNA ligase family protein, partial [Candidatus Diapherotrites archaeon]|nr:class I tRNA ligase family protein [Candidatus Diapherotrites archaeon]